MKNFIKSNKILLIFICFFLIVFIENYFMCLYHDDYGYLSLSYEYVVKGVEGHVFNFKQLIEFLIGHYNIWGGRILYFGIECLILSKSILLYKFIQSIIITLIYYYIYKILKKHTKFSNILLAISSISCYGFFEIMVIRTGIFWPTASVLYVFPVLPLLMFIYYYDSNNSKTIKNILMGILILFATFSQEQISVAALSYIAIITIYDYIKNKKLNKINIAMLIIALIGFGILMLSPGSKIRMTHPTSIEFYELSFTEKILKNYPTLILNIFSSYSKIFISILFISISYLSYKNYKKKENILNIYTLVSNMLIMSFTLLTNTSYFELIYNFLNNSIYKNIVLVIFTIQIFLMLYAIIKYFIDNKIFIFIWITIIALISQASMLVAPYYPLRSSIIFQILLSTIIVYVICYLLEKKKNKYILILPIILLSLFNILTITKGYLKNYKVNINNDKILINVSKEIKKGKKIKEIKLKELPNILYSGDQPYTENNDYILIWMKEYYNLPKNIKIIYEK